MRRTCVLRTCAGVLRNNFAIKKKSVPPPPEGREAKAYMRNGFTAGFCHVLGTIKIWIQKKLFLCGKKYKLFEAKKKT